MAAIRDFQDESRFKADPDFRVLDRKGITIGTVILMPPPIRSSADRQFIVTLKYEFRWDLLAHDLVGNVNLKWVLMRHNRIADPLVGPIVGQRLLIPTSSQVAYYLNRV